MCSADKPKLQKTESCHCSNYFKLSESSWQKPEGQMFVYIKHFTICDITAILDLLPKSTCCYVTRWAVARKRPPVKTTWCNKIFFSMWGALLANCCVALNCVVLVSTELFHLKCLVLNCCSYYQWLNLSVISSPAASVPKLLSWVFG